MSIYDVDLLSEKTKLEKTLERIKTFEPEEGYYLAFSGGKDSITCYHLLKMANVKFDAHYANTTVDPPDLIYFIREKYPDVKIYNPKISMWRLIEKKKMPPTRLVRYCCRELKEEGGKGRFVVTGVRRAESTKRSKRKDVEFDVYGSQSKEAINKREKFYLLNDNTMKRNMIENCTIEGKNILNPIIDWEDCEVWEFIKNQKIEYPSLYDEGFNRIGCVGCPMGGPEHQKKEFERYPKIRANYIRAFERMINARIESNLKCDWKTGEDVMDWWLGDLKLDKENENQLKIKLDEMIEEDESK